MKDGFGNQAPFYFGNSILDIYSTLKTGATTYIIPKILFAQPVPLLEYLKEKKINTIFRVPSALIVVAKLNVFRNVDLTDTLWRVLFCGIGKLRPKRKRRRPGCCICSSVTGIYCK